MTFSIKRELAAQLYEIYERALRVLSEAEPIIFDSLEADAREAYAEAHSKVIVDILSELRAPLVIQYRDLDTHVHEGRPDTLLDADEQAAVDRLTAVEVQRIDDALLSDCVRSARKVARIVGNAWMQLRDELQDVQSASTRSESRQSLTQASSSRAATSTTCVSAKSVFHVTRSTRWSMRPSWSMRASSSR